MPFIPHTEAETKTMLNAIGVDSIEQLFDEIPAELRINKLSNVPVAMSEMEIGRLMSDRAEQDAHLQCFIGAGSYEHHIPAAVWEITTRGEFYSAYTPYQAEASQGTLQLLYEYQTMMAEIMVMEVSNASLYDGGSALAEAVLMAVRSQRKKTAKRIIMPRAVNPNYRRTVRSIVSSQNIELIEVDYDKASGQIVIEDGCADNNDISALIIPQPNFFGVIEEVDALTNWAHKHNILVIGVVNPIAMQLLKAPGQWGESGADIVCGEGQPLGIPLSSGGPYFGFMCCKEKFVRQMPGRIIGRTVDVEGKQGFSLTLQAREQHIRRSKATSNICTNQGLMVTAATIHMSLLGAEGLARVAAASHKNTLSLITAISEIDGVKAAFNNPCFHESVIQLARPASAVLDELIQYGILGGYDLSKDYPELGNAILICATETKTDADIAAYSEAMHAVMHDLPIASNDQ
ncbi:aminomethyl-transferring glycine dehydrogenase subunit GcvPA [Gammaproteobacteria bacterium AH-315-C21]|nr:aminomethyl-transferring glycine dehydrogenase subunit GcvPA [Gammaproteobacteria bacterium AH-315-C21]